MTYHSLPHTKLKVIARRYCEAIRTALGRPSPYFTTSFLHEMKSLSERIMGSPNKTGWTKMTKPSLDSIGNWLEGRLTKFIAGEGDSLSTGQEAAFAVETPAYSAFSHFSSISSAAPSTSSSPQPSTHSFPAASRRTASTTDYSNQNPYPEIDRASSAMDYSRPTSRKPSPGPKIVSASAAMSSFSQSPSYPQTSTNGYAPTSAQSPMFSQKEDSPTSGLDSTAEEKVEDQAPSWWNPSYSYDTTNQTPTASAFPRDDDEPRLSGSGSGFISLMDMHPIPMSSASSQSMNSDSQYSRTDNDLEDDDDLGLGNSKRRKEESTTKPPTTQEQKKEMPKVEEPKRPGKLWVVLIVIIYILTAI